MESKAVKPATIDWFERLYLAAFAVRLVNAVLNIGVANSGLTQVAITVSLLFWYGVVFQHSAVSKWLLVVSYPFVVWWAWIALMTGRFGMPSVIAIVLGLALHGASLVCLLMEKDWFAKARG